MNTTDKTGARPEVLSVAYLKRTGGIVADKPVPREIEWADGHW